MFGVLLMEGRGWMGGKFGGCVLRVQEMRVQMMRVLVMRVPVLRTQNAF